VLITTELAEGLGDPPETALRWAKIETTADQTFALAIHLAFPILVEFAVTQGPAIQPLSTRRKLLLLASWATTSTQY
jgi:hypothetical protein